MFKQEGPLSPRRFLNIEMVGHKFKLIAMKRRKKHKLIIIKTVAAKQKTNSH